MTDEWSTFGVDLHLDLTAGRVGGEGVRAALERSLREAIRDGRLTTGALLPATRVLASELGLSRGTVSAAYDQLVAEGYLIARHGSGTRVAEIARPEPRATRGTPRPPRHDLRPGTPDVGSFPVAAWLSASRRALGSAPPAAFAYGDSRGRPELRAALADYLGRARGVDASPGRIVVTAGYVQALTLLAHALREGAFALEDPGLPFHREVLRFNGRDVRPLRVDAEGADPASLPADVAAAVVTPAHQYPTGVTLHPERRRALVAWARATDAVVVEDDYDGEFRYDRQPVGALQGTAPDSVVYIGTASKTLAPGVRLAWMVLPGRLVEPVMRAKRLTDFQSEALGQLTLAEFITSHAYDRHVRASRGRYRRRRDLLLSELEGYSLEGVAAGQHVLLGLPPGAPPEAQLLRRASARGLAFGLLGEHWHEPSAAPRTGLVIGYGTPRDGAFPSAVAELSALLGDEAGG
ncbi:PLP-dependent aminotransferase family protein [Streptacidiphilus jiangxiensis]|uniref:GntR family transcriptional regulator / MocR family aminotransferase n=1 Tax=Streptacidiphilus jiangxiensis TaxID=235985 RepID=A0A1H7PSU0_STRJI|nr:PLP-dependent aminotransferase family protein [Streptacidiphilus jiangxiensis]SEL38822.1 GntR family transcriptional regulator / MocR family aminotransferase [Streptacidiphilus jiangxiensis]